MARLVRERLTFANAVAVLALFIALGGVGYAATQLPKNSVGTRQLKKGAVTKAKIRPATVQALRGATGPTGPSGPAGPQGPPGPAGGTLPAGVTLRGVIAAGRGEDAASAGTISAREGVEFGGYTLPTRPLINIVPDGFPGIPTPPACPGTRQDPQAAPGNLCVYVELSPSKAGTFTVFDPTVGVFTGLVFDAGKGTFKVEGDGRASRIGFGVVRAVESTMNVVANGSWAVTAG